MTAPNWPYRTPPIWEDLRKWRQWRIVVWFKDDFADCWWDMANSVRSLLSDRMPKYSRVERFLRDYGQPSRRYEEVDGLRDAIYKALSRERPLRIWHWAGDKDKDKTTGKEEKTGRVLVVGLTATRVISWQGDSCLREANGLVRLDTFDCPLENVVVRERWVSSNVFRLFLINQICAKASGGFVMPYSNVHYVREIRSAAMKLPGRARRARIMAPIATVIVAIIAAAIAFWALWLRAGPVWKSPPCP